MVPFPNAPWPSALTIPGTTYKGNVTTTQDDLNAWVEKVHRAGIQINCHANGDVAIDMYLTAFERAQKLFPRPDARPKITHCTLINDDLVRRMKALDAVPALFTTYAYYNSDKFSFYGEDLMKRCMAFRTLLDAGIHAAAGSDFSPGPFDPRMAIQGMVTRTGWDGKTWGAIRRSRSTKPSVSTRSTAPITLTRRTSKARSRPANWPTMSSWPKICTPFRWTGSRTSKSSAPLSAARRFMKVDSIADRSRRRHRGPARTD